MSAFTHTALAEGEVLVIGPVTFSSTGSVSFSAGKGQSAQVSQTNRRVIGITNRRVIVETGNPQETAVVPNGDVKRVYVRREKMGSKIEKIETTRGQTLKLSLGGLTPADEARLFELFPNAEIGESKGLFGGFSRLSSPPVPAPRVPAPARAPARPAAPPARPAPAAAPVAGVTRSHIDDADVHSLDDLRRYYPLSPEYEYVETAGEYRVQRVSDGMQFPILLEEELLGFDVPVQDPKRKKVTVEVFKQK